MISGAVIPLLSCDSLWRRAMRGGSITIKSSCSIHFVLMKQSRTITRFARLLRFSIYLGFVPSLRPFTPK